MAESSVARAWTDSKTWLLNHILSLVLSFLLPGIGTVLATWFIPPNVDLKLVAVYGFLGGLAGFVLLIIGTYIWNLIRAPYRQRNEVRALLLAKPKPIPLSNRETLIQAIVELRQSAVDLLNWQGRVNKLSQQSPFTMQADINAEKDTLDNNYNEAGRNLDIQMNVAGNPFKDIVLEYYTFLTVQTGLQLGVFVDVGNKIPKLSIYELIGKIGAKEDEIKSRINAVVSGQFYPVQTIPDKEDS